MTAALRLKIELMYEEGRGDTADAEDYIMKYTQLKYIDEVRVGPGRAACGVFVTFEPGMRLKQRSLDKVARRVVSTLQSMHYADNIRMTHWKTDAVEVGE